MTRDILWICAALAFGSCAYESGKRAGAEDGWWSCMAEHGEVS